MPRQKTNRKGKRSEGQEKISKKNKKISEREPFTLFKRAKCKFYMSKLTFVRDLNNISEKYFVIKTK